MARREYILIKFNVGIIGTITIKCLERAGTEVARSV
jgi:hypothetical protein